MLREVRPGEIVRLDKYGLTSVQGHKPAARPALCVFEYVYFARPDSRLEDQSIHRVRQRLGEELARESAVEADIVIGVPDSATPAAIGFARAANIPYSEGLTKNRYIGRTFIQPDDRLRRSGIHLKYNPLTANLADKRVVLVDDSIVRGNTAGPMVRLLRDAGATEVHVRVSSPPVRHPCFMGVDMATHEELIAYSKSIEEIRRHIGADSLAYLSEEGMMRAVTAERGEDTGHCSACFTGNYPISLDEWWEHKEHEKMVFESMWGS
jgi:amidophosphoribosyltransferase